MSLDLDAILARAKVATPGPWMGCPATDTDPGTIRTATGDDQEVLGGAWCNDGTAELDGEPEDIAHVAGMDPSTTIALVERLQAAEEHAGPMGDLEGFLRERGYTLVETIDPQASSGVSLSHPGRTGEEE